MTATTTRSDRRRGGAPELEVLVVDPEDVPRSVGELQRPVDDRAGS